MRNRTISNIANFFTALIGASLLSVNGTAMADDSIQPKLAESQRGESLNFQLVFNSDFSNPDVLDLESEKGLWRHEDMASSKNSSQHRQAKGRRHAAWYDRFRDETAFIRDGVLVQRGHVADADLPGFTSRDAGDADRNYAYVDPDPRDAGLGEVNFADFEMHTSWLDTFALKDVDGDRIPVQRGDRLSTEKRYKGEAGFTDTRSPNITFNTGTNFEIEVNFEGMEALAHRHSFWLMPATGERVAYDDDPANGLEIDIYEHELAMEKDAADRSQDHEKNEFMLMKSIGGSTKPGSTFNELREDGQTLIRSPGINRGWHRIGLLWTSENLTWFIDDEPVVRDSKLVPQVPMYLIVSREANTGASRRGHSSVLRVNGDKIPNDPGLLGRNVATPVNRDLIKKGGDEVLVRSVRAWKVSR